MAEQDAPSTPPSGSSNWVAIAAIIVSGVTSIFSGWSAHRSEIKVAEVKASGDRVVAEIKAQNDAIIANMGNELKRQQDSCQRIIVAAKELGGTYGSVYHNVKLDDRDKLHASLWAAAAFLPEKWVPGFLEAYQKGPAKGDDFGLRFTEYLVGYVLEGLVVSAQDCKARANLPPTK